MKEEQQEALAGLDQRCPKVATLLRKGPLDRASFIPALQETERLLGHVPADCLDLIAAALDVPRVEAEWIALTIAGVSLMPGAKHAIRVCRGPNCSQRGSAELLQAVQAAAREVDPEGDCVDVGSTTCLGACSEGPNLLLDGMLLTHNSRESGAALVRRLCEAEKPENP